jgi:hypothetical protein
MPVFLVVIIRLCAGARPRPPPTTPLSFAGASRYVRELCLLCRHTALVRCRSAYLAQQVCGSFVGLSVYLCSDFGHRWLTTGRAMAAHHTCSRCTRAYSGRAGTASPLAGPVAVGPSKPDHTLLCCRPRGHFGWTVAGYLWARAGPPCQLLAQ